MRTAKLEGKKRTKLLQDVKEGLEKIRQAEADKLQADLPTKSTADLEKEAILTVGKLSLLTELCTDIVTQRGLTVSSRQPAAR